MFIRDGQDLETAMYESGKFSDIIRRGRHKKLILPEQEYAILMSEINTYYGKMRKEKSYANVLVAICIYLTAMDSTITMCSENTQLSQITEDSEAE